MPRVRSGHLYILKNMKFILLPLFIGFTFCLSAQNASVNHYLRKSNSYEIAYPGDDYKSNGLYIKVPDSIYNSGSILIKFLTVSDLKLRNFTFHFQENTIQKLSFTVKGKKDILEIKNLLISAFDDEFNATSTNQEFRYKDCNVQLTISNLGKKQLYNIQIID